MSNQSVISEISQQFSKDQIKSWALLYGVSESALFLAVKGLVPAAWLLWEKKHLQHRKVDTASSILESQLINIFHQNPAILPALAAFSGVPLSALQNLFPAVIHVLSEIMSMQFRGKTPEELTRWFHLENDKAEVLLPASIRAIIPELQATPLLVSPPRILSAWMEGLLWLLLLVFLFYLIH
jgi:hypothetical protein